MAVNGYKSVKLSDGSTAYEHVLIAERILGRRLGVNEVHHVNENKKDNRNSNLVICPDRSYHKLLHMRTEAYDACGHADYRKCWICKQYDDPKRMVNKAKHLTTGRYTHKACSTTYEKQRYRGN